jgi:hypothetical protein
MSKTTKHIVAVLIIVLPFYLLAILQKALFDRKDFLVEEFFGYYMLLSILGITVVLLTNKFLLKNNIKTFFPANQKLIYDFSLGLLLLGAFYFIQSVERYKHGYWIIQEIDRSAMADLINNIFSNFVHGVIIIGPFTWFNEAFAILSLAFILNNLWAINSKKGWILFSIFIAAIIFSLLQIDNGWSAVISSFILVSISNSVYYHYRSVIPLFLAATLFQTIDLISYWVYVM